LGWWCDEMGWFCWLWRDEGVWAMTTKSLKPNMFILQY
jgi:hypothetical protein